MTTLLNRIGNLGLLLIACALLLGGLAGAAVAHHYDRLAANTVATHQDDKGNGAQKPKKAKHQHGNQKHPNHGHQGGATGNEPAETD
ncbi:MAG TPA: hypothetical protein VIP78_11525 [Candidatus Dormibacteraeota bacterium]